MSIRRSTFEEVQDHLYGCSDGAECTLRTAEAWAARVAAPEHVDEVRDTAIALHLADARALEHLDGLNMMTTFMGALLRRLPEKETTIERPELIEKSERVLIEQDEDDRVHLSIVPTPEDSALS